MTPFREIEARAIARHGEATLAARLVRPSTSAQLLANPDDRYLSALSMRVFAAGFRWRVIQQKWPGFEQAFQGFEPSVVADFDLDDVEHLLADKRIVRHRGKILATIANAQLVCRTAETHGSFGAWIAAWPTDNIIGLWDALQAGGQRLGGATAPWFLRMVGKDTFRLSPDVVAALVEAGVVSKAPTGKRARRCVQDAMNAWSAESGRSLTEISIILACSAGDIYPSSP